MHARLEQMIDRLEGRLTWKNAAIAFGVIVLANVAMGGYLLPAIQARRPQAVADGYLVMIDLQPLCSAEEMYRIFDLYTPDILGLVRLLYALGFVFPLAFAFVVAVLLAKLLRYLQVKRGGWRVCVLLPFAFLPFDYGENLLALSLTSLYQDGQIFPTVAGLAGVATALKFLCLSLTGLALVVLLLRTAVKRITSPAGAARS